MGKPRILVVDDNQINLRVTSVLLVTAGYEMGTAISADEASRKLPVFHPQLLVVAVGTHALDGLGLVHRLNADPAWRGLPIIALTAVDMPDAESTALAAGCVASLPKPVDVQALRRLIRQHLEPPAATPAPIAAEESGDLFAPQRAEFREKGVQECRRLLTMLPVNVPKRSLAPLVDYQDLRRTVHSWAGLGGTLGFPQITENARAAEALLTKPFEEIVIPLRRLVEDLEYQFAHAYPIVPKRPAVHAAPKPEAVVERKPVILIGEDDPIVSSLIKSTLESQYECRIADNGRLAFAMARNDPPDAMLLDVNMPNLDGFQVLEELRRLETTRKLRIMLLTARHDPADIRRGVHLGVNDYMVKPFEPHELIDRVRRLLE